MYRHFLEVFIFKNPSHCSLFHTISFDFSWWIVIYHILVRAMVRVTKENIRKEGIIKMKAGETKRRIINEMKKMIKEELNKRQNNINKSISDVSKYDENIVCKWKKNDLLCHLMAMSSISLKCTLWTIIQSSMLLMKMEFLSLPAVSLWIVIYRRVLVRTVVRIKKGI